MARLTDRIHKLLPRTWTPNQVVAHNLTRARLLRGWTQEQAAAALAPYLGAKLSVPSFSAIERSVAGTRVKQFTADELIALSRAFELPLGWWFTPPDEGALATPDSGLNGIDFNQIVDLTLGTPDTLPPWIEALEGWAAGRAGVTPTADVRARTGGQVGLRARTLVRERFGDLREARDVLRRLADLIDEMDRPTPSGTETADPAETRSAAAKSRTARSIRRGTRAQA